MRNRSWQATRRLETRDLTIRFGGHVAVNAVSCAFRPGTLTAIVGPNGAGKTTYFNLISGQLKATAGQVLLRDADVTRLTASARTKRGMGRAFQLTNLFPGLTVVENVRLAVQSRAGTGLDLFTPLDQPSRADRRGGGLPRQVRRWPSAARRPPARCRMAISASSRSPSCWRSSPRSSCSTSRPPA